MTKSKESKMTVSKKPFEVNVKATRSGSTMWQVNVRYGSMIEHHKFWKRDEAEAFIESKKA